MPVGKCLEILFLISFSGHSHVSRGNVSCLQATTSEVLVASTQIFATLATRKARFRALLDGKKGNDTSETTRSCSMKEISNKKSGWNGLCSQSVSGIYDNESCVIMRLDFFFKGLWCIQGHNWVYKLLSLAFVCVFFLRFDSETHEFDPDESTFSIPTNEVKVDGQVFLMKTRYCGEISVSVTLTKTRALVKH